MALPAVGLTVLENLLSKLWIDDHPLLLLTGARTARGSAARQSDPHEGLSLLMRGRCCARLCVLSVSNRLA